MRTKRGFKKAPAANPGYTIADGFFGRLLLSGESNDAFAWGGPQNDSGRD